MKIIKLFKQKSNTFDKKVYNKSLSNHKLTKFLKKSLKLKEILLTTQYAKNIKLLQIQVKHWIDIKVLVKNKVKETQYNFSIKLTIKIKNKKTWQEKERVLMFPETLKDFKLESIFINKQWKWRKRKNHSKNKKWRISNHWVNLRKLCWIWDKENFHNILINWLEYKTLKIVTNKITILWFLLIHLIFVSKDFVNLPWNIWFLCCNKWKSWKFLWHERSLLIQEWNWLIFYLRIKRQSFWVRKRIIIEKFKRKLESHVWTSCLWNWLRWDKITFKTFTTGDCSIRDI